MSSKSYFLPDELYEYLLSVSLREPDVLKELREETATLPESRMQIAPEQGQFLRLLVRLAGVTKALEIGVFTGYSSLSAALALPEGGTLDACDVSEEWTQIAQRYWKQAAVDDKIDLHLAPATETLSELIGDGQSETFDYVFIDADKTNYDTYYEKSLQLVRSGGLIIMDNMFRSGRVVDNTETSESVTAIQKLNQKLHDDNRVHLSLLPVADGVTLALKK